MDDKRSVLTAVHALNPVFRKLHLHLPALAGSKGSVGNNMWGGENHQNLKQSKKQCYQDVNVWARHKQLSKIPVGLDVRQCMCTQMSYC